MKATEQYDFFNDLPPPPPPPFLLSPLPFSGQK